MRDKVKKPKEGMVEEISPKTIIAQIILMIIVGIMAVICILPMWHVVMSSISDGFSLMSNKGLALLPVGNVTFDGYKLIFQDASIIKGYLNTIFYVVGTVGLGFVLNVLGGYAISQNTKLSGIMSLYLLIPLLFGGGLIPTYMVLHALGLVGTRWVIILLEATIGMYVILGSMAFRGVPASTVESARLDGANHFQVMFKVMFPQCKGMFMVTILMTFVGSWNSWMNAKIYLAGERDKWPIQLWIQQIIADNKSIFTMANPDYNRYLIQYAVIAVSTVPILLAIPFLQKYIEAGALQGAIKE